VKSFRHYLYTYHRHPPCLAHQTSPRCEQRTTHQAWSLLSGVRRRIWRTCLTPWRPTKGRTHRKVREMPCSMPTRARRTGSLIYGDDEHAAVMVLFKAVGNAPIMKKNVYTITASNRFQAVIQFLRKQLGWKAGDPLVRQDEGLYPSEAMPPKHTTLSSSPTLTPCFHQHRTTPSQTSTRSAWLSNPFLKT
jgi:hypothetical protein